MRYVLAIDMGSSSVKAAVVSARAEVAAASVAAIDTVLLDGGGAEHDPAQWWRAILHAATTALREAAVPPEDVMGVACTTQWAVTVPVNGDGDPIANALSWMDTRGGPYARRATAGRPSIAGYGVKKLRTWIRLSGGAPTRSGVDGFGHVLFWKHERPEIYRETYKFLEPMDYINLRLTGRAAASFGTIFPYSVTDNCDPNAVRYHPDLLAIAGFDPEKLPELQPVDAILGTLKPDVAKDLGLLPSTRVVMGQGDSHAATIGAGCIRNYDGYFCIGTTSWMSCHVPRMKSDVRHSLGTMPAALPGRYIVTAEQGTAGRCLAFLKDRILFPGGDDDAYANMNREAASAPAGSEGLIFTPWINGSLAPGEDHTMRSAFFNQSARTTRAHYIRAVMEGVAYNLRWLKGHVEKFIGRPFPRLNFIGGGATSPLWCQILADVLECPVGQVANARHANAVGAAMAAFAALGEIRVSQIAPLIHIAAHYRPNPAHREIYAEQFRAFREFYKLMKPVYRRLNRE